MRPGSLEDGRRTSTHMPLESLTKLQPRKLQNFETSDKKQTSKSQRTNEDTAKIYKNLILAQPLSTKSTVLCFNQLQTCKLYPLLWNSDIVNTNYGKTYPLLWAAFIIKYSSIKLSPNTYPITRSQICHSTAQITRQSKLRNVQISQLHNSVTHSSGQRQWRQKIASKLKLMVPHTDIIHLFGESILYTLLNALN